MKWVMKHDTSISSCRIGEVVNYFIINSIWKLTKEFINELRVEYRIIVHQSRNYLKMSLKQKIINVPSNCDLGNLFLKKSIHIKNNPGRYVDPIFTNIFKYIVNLTVIVGPLNEPLLHYICICHWKLPNPKVFKYLK